MGPITIEPLPSSATGQQCFLVSFGFYIKKAGVDALRSLAGIICYIDKLELIDEMNMRLSLDPGISESDARVSATLMVFRDLVIEDMLELTNIQQRERYALITT